MIKTIEPGTKDNDYGQTAITPDGKFLYMPIGASALMLDTVTYKIVGNAINLGTQAIAVAPTAPFACTIGSSGNNDEGELYVFDISPE